ncbi:FAD/NAD(P)-binding domain-containing protein [Basidiobolus meristosporus CBS 931.73]|uniref:FAD/NAD(P)-binding domain-containing protein n=1 Tax=Basidiobolus meristosporus CBS 931.73 TaxID=1314790 RepID=A0A1Y1YBM8_9FUNG|nr:FAD/NAD(P)-binding domain-containing protein [Basidiobolus meristosporus CBS 931.73]|eukprot:ORX95451.1 FAD/NAD(P)-binding domain-containing protein [Basidiobolus meristosporus CBS 931.73]
MSHSSITIRQAIIEEVCANHVKLANCNEVIDFDYLILALGQSRGGPIGVGASTKNDYVKDLNKHHKDITSAKSIVVVGGGAVGIEMASDIKCDFPEKDVTLIHSRPLPIPGPFKDEFRQETIRILKEDIGVNVILGERVVNDHSENALTTTSQRKIAADWVINCLGTASKASIIKLPSSTDNPIFSPAGIRISKTMQINDPKYQHIFAVGDICDSNIMKLAGIAMYGGCMAAKNLSALITSAQGESPELEKFPDFPSKLLLLMGKNHFIFQLGDEVWEREKTREFVHEDMGLELCMNALAIRDFPKPETTL